MEETTNTSVETVKQATTGESNLLSPKELETIDDKTVIDKLRRILPVNTNDPTANPQSFQGQFYLQTGGILWMYMGNTWTKVGSSTVAGKIYLNSAQNIANNSLSAVNIDTSSIAVGVTVDTTNKRLTVLTAGYYLLSGQVCWGQTTDGKNYKSYIDVNGGEVVTGYAHASVTGNYYLTSPLNTIIYLNVGDQVKLYCSQVSGNSQSLVTGSNYTYLAINKI